MNLKSILRNWKEHLIAFQISFLLLIAVIAVKYFSKTDLYIDAKSLLAGIVFGIIISIILTYFKMKILFIVITAIAVVVWIFLPVTPTVSSLLSGFNIVGFIWLIPFFSSVMVQSKQSGD